MGNRLSPEVLGVIAKQLADLSGAFAQNNPLQEGLSAGLSDRLGGLVRAQTFNTTQRDLSGQIRSILGRDTGAQPGPGLPNQTGTGSALTPPGTAGGPVPLTPRPQGDLGDAGLVDPLEIDPFQAIALGQQGTEETIRQTQIERARVDRALERQQDFKNRLQVMQQNAQLRQDLLDFQIKQQELSEQRTGRTAERAVGTRGQGLRNIRTEQDIFSAETPQEAGAQRAATLESTQQQAETRRIENLTLEERNAAELAAKEKDVGLSPGEIASVQGSAIRQVRGGMLRTVTQRLDQEPGGADDLAALNQILQDLGSGTLDEAGRQSNFDALTAILTDEELEFFQGQLSTAEQEIVAQRLPSGAVPIGTTAPIITDVDEASLADALRTPRSEEEFLTNFNR